MYMCRVSGVSPWLLSAIHQLNDEAARLGRGLSLGPPWAKGKTFIVFNITMENHHL